jgi:ATP-dependent DNA ligase
MKGLGTTGPTRIPAAVCTPSVGLFERKAGLAKLLRKAGWALRLNEHIDEPEDVVFRHACKLGLEGIVSKCLGSPYRSGRSRDWIKSKNLAAAAVKANEPKKSLT